MAYDEDKVDEMVLALLYLNQFNDGAVTRAWKNLDWDAMDRLHEKGYISNPKGKAKSVTMSEKGEAMSEKLFRKHFGKA